MEERFYTYFESKLKLLPKLREYSSSLDNPEFEKWRGSIEATCERMGPNYLRRVQRINFFPNVLTSGDDSEMINKRYQSGLNQAEAFIETLMEELQTWGLDDNRENGQTRVQSDTKQIVKGQTVNVYLTLSQQQAQQIIQSIDLGKYDEDTRKKINELFTELKKEEKDKTKISTVIKWLADKSVDALIAILLATSKLT